MSEDPSKNRPWRQRWSALGVAGPLGLMVVGGPALGAAVLVATSGSWLPPLQALEGLSATAAFLLTGVPLVGLSLIPTHAASLVAGMLFGRVEGSGLALAAVVIAAAACHRWLRPWLEARTRPGLERRPRVAAVHRALLESGERRAVALIALVRLSPVMPFAATNVLLAAAGVGSRAFLIGSALGLAPRVIAVAVAGAGLAELDLARASDARLALFGGLATIATLFVIGRIARRALRRATADERSALPAFEAEPGA